MQLAGDFGALAAVGVGVDADDSVMASTGTAAADGGPITAVGTAAFLGNQLEAFVLPRGFVADGLSNLGIDGRQRSYRGTGGRPLGVKSP